MKKILAILAAGCLICAAAQAADWYVKAGSDGDGTKAAPFGDPWKALEKAVRGDVIHVAQGRYNGKGGSGHFVVKVPNLTLVGGYSADFSARDPFKNTTILERAKDFRGDWTGLPEGIIAGDSHADHSGLIVDGFVLNGESRNVYGAEGDINIAQSYKGVAFLANKPNIKIRNCIILNPLGDGVYCAWGGKDNEIVNTFIVNTFYNAVATRSAQPNSAVKIKNCTIAFCWFYPSKGGGMSVFVGRQGQTIMENNVFAFNQTEGDEAGFGVSNTFGNSDTALVNNLFFQCQGGYYKYMDGNKQSLIAWKPADLNDLNKDGESYMLAATGGNSDEDPKMSPDKAFFEKFSNFVASQPGKPNMDAMNEWRRSVGLPLQAEPGSKRKNYGMAYPLSAVAPNLVAKVKDRGVRLDGPFAVYGGGGTAAKAGEEAAPTAAAKDYAEVVFDAFKKGAAGVKQLAGKPVAFKAGLGMTATSWFLKAAPRENYACVRLLLPGETDATRRYVFGYLLKGSAADKDWAKLLKKRDSLNAEGVTIKGTAFYIGSDTYDYPVGILIDEVGK
ncbi:MAG: right-handed parallel beta-helix repeat-containing protein [Candidatus Aminicenantes bacterium]|nr:right-handed parallel beta-helix repeat-containing protein [Candidatus Aminicenantes bacterium]